MKTIYKKVSYRIFSVNSLTGKRTNLYARTLTLMWLSIARKKGKAGFHLRSSARQLLKLFSELGAHFELEDIHL